ncbi:RING-like zinc finger [Fragilaria crotonensis]|nr:RING-like zinc finger [Fragilaria crotonensis]
MDEGGNIGRCLACRLRDTNGQNGEFCTICAVRLQLLDGILPVAAEASMFRPESSPGNALVESSNHQHVSLIVPVVDYIPSQTQHLQMRAFSPNEFRILVYSRAFPGANFREVDNGTTVAGDTPSEEELVHMIVELFLSYVPQRRLVCDATIDNIPRTNLKLDHSKLYRAAVQVDGREKLNAIVINPGLQSLPLNGDKTLVSLGSSNITIDEQCRFSTLVEDEAAIVILERWRDIPDRTIEILRSLSFGGLILIDNADAASCITQYTKARFPNFLPVIVVKEYAGEALLRQRRTDPSRLVCKLTLEIAVERECSICFEQMDMVMHFPQCGHIIHETCGVKWLRSQKSCPYCRQELTDIHDHSDNQDTAPRGNRLHNPRQRPY